VEILLETVEAPAARREPRVPSRVEFHRDAAGDLRFLGYLSDISATGAFIQCSRPRDIGTQLRVRLHLGRAEHEIIDLDAEVIWTRSYAGKNGPSAGMGLEFKNLEAASRTTIGQFCAGDDPNPNPRI
jgi:uncharacterized protein (TIGR02266 family)